MEIDHKYTWVLPRKAWYIRLYLLLWRASAQDITFCKLFWGYVLAWAAILFWIGAILPYSIAVGVTAIADRRKEKPKEPKSEEPRVKEPRALRIQQLSRPVVGQRVAFKCVHGWSNFLWLWPGGDPYYGQEVAHHIFNSPGKNQVTVIAIDDDGKRYKATKEIKVHIKPSIGVRFLEAVSSGFTGLSMALSPVFSLVKKGLRRLVRARVTRRLAKVVAYGLAAIGGASVVIGAGYGCFALFTQGVPWTAVGNTMGSVATTVGHYAPVTGAGLLAVVITLLLFYVLIIAGFFVMLRAMVFQPVATGTKYGALGFRRMMMIGYKAVKTNTCPRVVIDEGDE